jgi:hypothetical protein
MVKNNILYIFIYVLLVGCGDSVMTNSCSSDCHLDISAPSLEMDENGYYHIEWLDGYGQTFSTLTAETGLDYQKVNWTSNKEINIQHYGQDNWTNLVNTSSYTDDEGVAHTVLGVWEQFVGDTIKVYSGYSNNCDILYIDSLEVVVDYGR